MRRTTRLGAILIVLVLLLTCLCVAYAVDALSWVPFLVPCVVVSVCVILASAHLIRARGAEGSLNGIVSFRRLECLQNEQRDACQHFGPRRVYILGEVHGRQRCGEKDYVSTYKDYFDTHERLQNNRDANERVTIDVFFEVDNLVVAKEEQKSWLGHFRKKSWLGQLRDEFQVCFRHLEGCAYQHARFHWTDPIHNHQGKAAWLNEMDQFLHEMLSNNVSHAYESCPGIVKNIKSKKDVSKIIFHDEFVASQAARSSIRDVWKLVVRKVLDQILSIPVTSWNFVIPITTERDKLAVLIFHVFRFRMDVYTLLRMFRAPKHKFKNEKWNNEEVSNVIYHCGDWHASFMDTMLRILKYKSSGKVANIDIKHDQPNPTLQLVQPACLQVDMERDLTFDE